MEQITSTAPSHWASYLINGDASGMNDQDIDHCDAWLNWVDAGAPVYCEDAGFCWRHDARPFGALAADC